MRTIQIAIADLSYVARLSRMLEQNGAGRVVCVDVPDVEKGGVLVMDGGAFDRLSSPLSDPERVVLVARGGSRDPDRAFEAGIKSVVSNRDPLDTVLLAIMAADLRASRSAAAEKSSVAGTSSSRPGGSGESPASQGGGMR
ncbi:MAG: hypothetical protein M1541_20785 [Acidobacteria bacterium]|nr:hypothetical protein [Acidobacteriota bacterium]